MFHVNKRESIFTKLHRMKALRDGPYSSVHQLENTSIRIIQFRRLPLMANSVEGTGPTTTVLDLVLNSLF
jgi:hypothetical protein